MVCLDNRQVTQAHVVTQVITRASTTFTAYVTLGGGPIVPVTDAVTTPTPDAAPPAPTPPASASSTTTSLSNEQLGAILGSVLGFIFIVLPLCYCCFRRQRYLGRYPSSYSDSMSERSTEIVVESYESDAWRMSRPEPVLIPPPPRIPPTRHTPYRHPWTPQIGGVRRY